jgi:GxxExxY protein
MNTEHHDQPYDPLGFDLIGACIEVQREMGSGFLEDVYQECLELELNARGIPFIAQPKLELSYKGVRLKKHYEADLIVSGQIVVELKAVKSILPEHEAQFINYLKATGKRVGYLVNFASHPKLDWRRRVFDRPQ